MKIELRQRRGMTLIEILIVVSILGILAAIVIPRYSNAQEDAKGAHLATQISTINKALTLYKGDHNDVYPTEAQLVTNQWQVLINSTDVAGNTTGDNYGPYFMSPPKNKFQDGDTTVALDNTGAWQYNTTTGRVQAVVPQDIYDRASDFKLDTSDLVVEP